MLLAALFLYLCSTGFTGEKLIHSLEGKYLPPANISGDVIVVLGGGATSDTPDFDGLGNLSGEAANRMMTAARLHFRTGLPILLSGGQVFADSGNEAEIAKRQLISLHVPPEKIILENRSLNTAQNAEFVSAILRERQFEKPVLVTSAFHMARSVIHFHNNGIVVEPYPAGFISNNENKFYFIKLAPSYSGLSMTGLAFKEYLGIIAAKL